MVPRHDSNVRPAAYLAPTGYKPAALPLSYWGQGGHAGRTRTGITRVATSHLTISDTGWDRLAGQQGFEPDLRFWRPPSCHWTTDPQGVVARRPGFEQVPKIQSLVSCRLDERRMSGTAGAIRTPVLDRRRVALCSSELQPCWRYAETCFRPQTSAFAWLPETVSNRRHPLCKSGALPTELPGSGRGGRNRTDSGGVMSPRPRPPPPQ